MNSSQDHIDTEMLNELKEVMEDDFEILINTFLTDSESRLEDVECAYDSLDGEKLRGSAHSFKGSCSNVGAAKLAEICKKVEELGKEDKPGEAGPLIEEIKTEFDAVRIILKEHIN